MPKLLRVNLTKGQVHYEDVPEKYRMLSGRSLTSQIVFDEVDPTCEPLGELNKLVIAPGLFAGTRCPNSNRIFIGAKSPLTGTIKESNGGGTVARKLAKLGIKGIVIEGKPVLDAWNILLIRKDTAVLVPSQELLGLGNFKTMESLYKSYGAKIGIMSIGQAGEMMLATASVAVSDPDGLPNRHCGRGGLGAVLGSKKIKAIVVDDTGANDTIAEIADPEGFNEVCKEWTKQLAANTVTLRNFGTTNLVNPINAVGGLPVRNFSRGSFDRYEKINGQALADACKAHGGKVGHACSPGCVVRCSNVYHDKNGNYVVSAIEFETVALFGSNLDIDNLETVARLNRLCNDYGVDTMDVGGALGVAMEAGLAHFGDEEAALNMVEQIGKGTVLGRLIGSGSTITGKVLGVRRVPAAKGQNMSAYDPRALKGTGVTYATGTQGADHTLGNGLPGRFGVDTNSKEHQLEVSRKLQIMTAVVDGLGLCLFIGPMPPTMDILAKVVSKYVGREITHDDLLEWGKKLLKLELAFNKAAGLTSADDRLPSFFSTEPLEPKGVVFDFTPEELDSVLNF
jgi:aldehyde:ferredoxin oxidoreductase